MNQKVAHWREYHLYFSSTLCHLFPELKME
jgi:hypothetical protein